MLCARDSESECVPGFLSIGTCLLLEPSGRLVVKRVVRSNIAPVIAVHPSVLSIIVIHGHSPFYCSLGNLSTARRGQGDQLRDETLLQQSYRVTTADIQTSLQIP